MADVWFNNRKSIAALQTVGFRFEWLPMIRDRMATTMISHSTQKRVRKSFEPRAKQMTASLRLAKRAIAACNTII